jgi:mono/diheme cytochrome c family protein
MTMTFQILAMLLVAMLLGGHSAPHQDQISKLTANDLARGQKLFVAHCALCHGIGGTGGRGPSLNQPELQRAADNQSLFRIIRNGIEGAEMPGAWQLTDREIWQVGGYVRSLGRTAVLKLPGDPVRGRDYYERKGGCVTCHIVGGRGGNLGPDLTNIGARRSASYLREALIDPGAAVPEGFLVVSAVTRNGEKVRGVRANEDSLSSFAMRAMPSILFARRICQK